MFGGSSFGIKKIKSTIDRTKDCCYILDMTNLSSVASDQMELLFMLLKLQNADKRACDLFPSYRKEKLCQLDFVNYPSGTVALNYGDITVLYSNGNDLYCFSDCDTYVSIDLTDLLKHISFEDKI